jgi:hypothetical protein
MRGATHTKDHAIWPVGGLGPEKFTFIPAFFA